ncbi:MAG: CBS domain-containing protein [Caldilineaceae bacterium]|nr:CBS domain-containing protein [Caldilineaceae bacterium]
MHRKLVRDIMETVVISIHPEELMVDGAQVMEDFDVRRLPVVDDDGCIVGIITDTDVLEAETVDSVLGAYSPDVDHEWLTVADIMTPDVITVGPEMTVGQLVQLFIAHKVSGMPVVEADPRFPKRRRLVGIVTEVDIFQMIADAWEAEAAALSQQ